MKCFVSCKKDHDGCFYLGILKKQGFTKNRLGFTTTIYCHDCKTCGHF